MVFAQFFTLKHEFMLIRDFKRTSGKGHRELAGYPALRAGMNAKSPIHENFANEQPNAAVLHAALLSHQAQSVYRLLHRRSNALRAYLGDCCRRWLFAKSDI